MSVLTYTNTPAQFQPVYSDGLFFTLSADTTNKFNFRYVFNLLVEDTLVFQGKATPNPFGLGIVDLSQILETFTDSLPISYYSGTPIYTHQTFPFSYPANQETISYQLVSGMEYSDTALGDITGFTGTGSIGVPAFASNVFKAFRSTMGLNSRATEQDFNINPYVLTGSSSQFLTNSPMTRTLDPQEYYTLGFTNYFLSQATGSTLSEPYYVKYTFYNSTGGTITATTYDNIVSNGGGPRTNCNYVYPGTYLLYPTTGTTDFNTLYVAAGPRNIPNIPTGATSYDVQLFGRFTGSTSPIQPSPTPTPTVSPGSVSPTPTPTPSTTPLCSGCTRYEAVYTGDCESFGALTITNCETGANQTFSLVCGQYYTFCSCAAPFTTPDIVLTTVGSCIPAVTPTTTPTQTKTPTVTPTQTKTPTPTPSVTLYNYLGRTAPDAADGATACSTYLTVRSYTGLYPLASIPVGAYIYDTYPSSPTVGGSQWVALKTGGSGPGYAFQIADDGEVLDKYTC